MLLLSNHPYWVFMDPVAAAKNQRFGSEYHEFLQPLGVDDYVIHPIALIGNQQILALLLEQLGVDAAEYQYRVEHDLLIGFKSKATFTAFILKFRESCRTWRKD